MSVWIAPILTELAILIILFVVLAGMWLLAGETLLDAVILNLKVIGWLAVVLVLADLFTAGILWVWMQVGVL